MSVRFARVSADFAESSRWVWAVLGFRAWEPKGVSYLIRLVDGSVGGTARMRAPRARDGAGEAIPRMRDRIADLLAREPFVLLVLALDALVVTFRLPDFVASDTWLALVSGRDVSRGWIPRHETLTVWSHGRTWVDQQWLGQLSMYGVHAAGGLRLLLLVHGAMLAGAFCSSCRCWCCGRISMAPRSSAPAWSSCGPSRRSSARVAAQASGVFGCARPRSRRLRRCACLFRRTASPSPATTTTSSAPAPSGTSSRSGRRRRFPSSGPSSSWRWARSGSWRASLGG